MASTSENKLSCKLGVLSRPDGSVLLCHGATAVIAGVYGPIEARMQKLRIDKATVEAYYRPKAGQPSVGDRLYESIIGNICETALVTALYPRTSVVIVIQEMQSAGEILACAINAASLALLEANIDLKYMVCAISCALDQNGVMHLNSLPITAGEPKAIFLFAFDSIEKNVLASHTSGSFSVEGYQQALTLCRENSEQVFEFFRTSVRATAP